MDVVSIMLLISLSGIWGGSFIFMRYLSPIFGAVITADLRLLVAGLSLVTAFTLLGIKLEWKKHWRHYLVIGLINSGVPFLLYSYAALHIPASISVIINSTAPIFVVVFSVLWLGDRFTMAKIFGLFLGITGVALVASLGTIPKGNPTDSGLAVFACVGAACCYGLSGVYIEKFLTHIPPKLLAAGSQAMVGTVFLPLIFISPPPQSISVGPALLLVAFALLCSAVAYLIYYRLVATVGPTKTLTVTFHMPVFGMLWGRLFLKEQITWVMVVGAGVILVGTFMVSFENRLTRRNTEASRAGSQHNGNGDYHRRR